MLSLLDLPVMWGETPRGALDLSTYVVLSFGTGLIGLVTEELLGFHELDASPVSWRGAPRAGIAELAKLREATVLVISPQSLQRELLGDRGE